MKLWEAGFAGKCRSSVFSIYNCHWFFRSSFQLAQKFHHSKGFRFFHTIWSSSAQLFSSFVILLMLWSVIISFDTNSSVRNQCSLVLWVTSCHRHLVRNFKRIKNQTLCNWRAVAKDMPSCRLTVKIPSNTDHHFQVAESMKQKLQPQPHHREPEKSQ